LKARLCLLFALLLVAGCGASSGSRVTTTASAPRTQTPSPEPSPVQSPLPVPEPSLLTASDCSGPAAGTAPRSLQGYYTVRLVSTWVDTGDYNHTETLLLELTAPESYGYPPTKIQFLGGPGPVHIVYGAGATAHSIAQARARTVAHDMNDPQAIAGAVSDCSTGGEPAAVFGYSDVTIVGYQLYVVHKDFLYVIRLSGTGGISSPAIADALEMIGSLTWTP
jgi:hypothetical protein